MQAMIKGCLVKGSSHYKRARPSPSLLAENVSSMAPMHLLFRLDCCGNSDINVPLSLISSMAVGHRLALPLMGYRLFTQYQGLSRVRVGFPQTQLSPKQLASSRPRSRPLKTAAKPPIFTRPLSIYRKVP